MILTREELEYCVGVIVKMKTVIIEDYDSLDSDIFTDEDGVQLSDEQIQSNSDNLADTIEVLGALYGFYNSKTTENTTENVAIDRDVTLTRSSTMESFKAGILKSRASESDYISSIGNTLTNGENSIYVNPINEDGKSYDVPIVSKNRDTLIGLNAGISFALDMINSLEPTIAIAIRKWINDTHPISSYVISQNGTVDGVVQEESEEHFIYLINHFSDYPTDSTLDDFWEIDITCGNCLHHIGMNANELPNDTLNCPSCGNLIIDYHYNNQEDIIYNDNEISQQLKGL